MSKFLFLITLCVTLLASMAMASNFNDVDKLPGDYGKVIDELNAKQIISGYPDGTFKPTKTLTRAELSKIIFTALIENDTTVLYKDLSNAKEFEDVKGTWSEKYVKICSVLGIIKGYDDGTFKPNNDITYAELCAIVCRLLKLGTEEIDKSSNWASEYFKLAEETGLLENIMTNDMIPVGKAQRMNVAMIVFNAMNYKSGMNKSGDNVEPAKEDPKKDDPKTDDPSKDKKYDTVEPSKIYCGVVTLQKLRAGIDYIDVDTFDGHSFELEVKNPDKKAAYKSLLIFETNKKSVISQVKELKQDVINSGDLLVVLESHDGLSKIEGQKEVLDISLDEWIMNGQKIWIDKYDYYLVEVSSDGKLYGYDDCNKIEKEDVSIKKEDRLLLDTKNYLFFIIRGIERKF